MLVYDIEIAKAIPPKKKTDILPDVQYCKGWDDHLGMGIACIGTYDTVSKESVMYALETEKTSNFLLNTVEFVNKPYKVVPLDFFEDAVTKADLVVGFNNLKFDRTVVMAHGIKMKSIEFEWDIIQAIWAAVGLSPVFNFRTHGGCSLGDICEANFGISKSGDGANAPILQQQGKFIELWDYCDHDIIMTNKVLDLILTEGAIKNPRNGKTIKVKSPYA